MSQRGFLAKGQRVEAPRQRSTCLHPSVGSLPSLNVTVLTCKRGE